MTAELYGGKHDGLTFECMSPHATVLFAGKVYHFDGKTKAGNIRYCRDGFNRPVSKEEKEGKEQP